MKFFNNFWPLAIGLAILPLLIMFNNCAGEMGSDKKSSSVGSNGGIPGSIDPVAGKAFFEATIKNEIIQKNCATCHNEPRFGGDAPLSIYDYAPMGFWLSNGPSATDNFLINKIQNIEPHEGGNQCSGGIFATPCKEIIEWRTIEYGGDGAPGGGTGGIGNVSYLSNTGRVKGWAVDPDDASAKVSVTVYIGGKAGAGGVEVGTYQANLFGLGGTYANHYFDFQLPAQFANGVRQDMYIYVDELTDEKLIPGSPRQFTAYTPSAAGQNYFGSSISGQLNCGSCHAWDYNTAYASLLTPTPAQGGTATNNNFYRYASGQNGHPGGNVCGGSLCNNIIQWWNTEFN